MILGSSQTCSHAYDDDHRSQTGKHMPFHEKRKHPFISMNTEKYFKILCRIVKSDKKND
jgi:hypothetical protein